MPCHAVHLALVTSSSRPTTLSRCVRKTMPVTPCFAALPVSCECLMCAHMWTVSVGCGLQVCRALSGESDAQCVCSTVASPHTRISVDVCLRTHCVCRMSQTSSPARRHYRCSKQVPPPCTASSAACCVNMHAAAFVLDVDRFQQQTERGAPHAHGVAFRCAHPCMKRY